MDSGTDGPSSQRSGVGPAGTRESARDILATGRALGPLGAPQRPHLLSGGDGHVFLQELFEDLRCDKPLEVLSTSPRPQ